VNNNRILLVASYPKSILDFRGDMMQKLIEKGLDVHVSAPNLSQYKKIIGGLNSLGVVSHNHIMKRASLNIISEIQTIFSLIKIFNKLKPNFFFGYTAKPVIWGTLVASLFRVPNKYCLISGLGYGFTTGDGYRRFLVRKILIFMYKAALSRCSKIFFQNKDDLNLFYELNIISKNKPVSIINGSGINLIKYSYKPIIDMPDKVNFLMISRLLKDKGIHEYIKAASIISNRFSNIKFTLVGSLDPNPTGIKSYEIKKLEREGIIEWIEEVDDVRNLISESHIYVLPSYREGTPRTVLEAMSIGRAIITTDTPGCRETVIDGDNGFLVRPKSYKDLINSMEKFILNKDLIKIMGKRSREIAEIKYDVDDINEKIINEMNLN
tara:strand:- start:1454 stop:2593 length:1140 start_codon:yes stop_codon:yes gene_type:complete